MKVYRGVLIVILIVAISCSIWYCLSSYNERRSIPKGTLVNIEKVLGELDERDCICES